MEVRLNSGNTIPAFGLGTWQSEKGAVGKAVDKAIRTGYRHIDGAYLYQNEDEIGETLQNLFQEGVVKREDLFITSKLSSLHMQSKADVIECCEEVLKNLRIKQLNLFLIHGPLSMSKDTDFPYIKEEDLLGYNESTMATVWEGMEELVARGLTKDIGISNFTITKTENLLKTAKIPPAVNQVECHPYLQQQKLRKYCNSKGIVLQCYAPLGSPGRVATESDDPVVMDDPVIKELATKYNATPAQICIAYLLSLGLVVIPKSVTDSRIVENFEATKITIAPEDTEKLRAIDRNYRLFSFKTFIPPTMPDLWDEATDDAYNFEQ